MLKIRRSGERGYFDHGWLKSFHTFSFGEYSDPHWIDYGPLRVINDDRIAPGAGFGKHGHRDMEILTYLLEGELEHRDSLGSGSVIRVGDVQRMSAGSGVLHSEFNPSATAATHLLQVWIRPDAERLAPEYEQRRFGNEAKRGRLALIAAGDGAGGALRIHQDARIYAGLFDGAERAVHEVAPGRRAWVHVARGALALNGTRLEGGDGAGVPGAATLELSGGTQAEVLVFDLP